MASNFLSAAPAAMNADPASASSKLSLYHTMHERRDEYIRPRHMRIKVGSWNVAACPGTDKDLASWFVDGKGIDKRLATLDMANSPAIERQDTADSLDAEPDRNDVRLVGRDKIDLYVLGLQEVEDLNVATQYMRGVVYSADPIGVVERWRTALEGALPPGYQFVTSEHMSGLLLLIYVSPDLAPSISNVSVSSVGTGLLGMGNKGAVAARVVVGETTRLTFVNCHLASGHDLAYMERRIWDAGQILRRAQFKPVPDYPGAPEVAGTANLEKIGDEDFGFWFGDLNFRLELPGDDIRRLLLLHTRGEYDVSKQGAGGGDEAGNVALDGEDAIVLRTSDSSFDQPDSASSRTRSSADDQSTDDSSISLPDPDDFLNPSDDPASLQATLDSLLPHDQLRRLMKEEKLFHDGWREGPITFLPSYKYDVGTVGLFDTSEKKRAPSWCDRILYRTRRDKEAYDRKIQEAEDSRRRDAEMKSRGVEEAAEDEVLFDYDPENDGDDQHSKSIPTSSNDSSKTDSSGTNMFEYDEYDEEADDGSGDYADVHEAGQDSIQLEVYTSHQRIQSSDHKPVVSVFGLDFDAAVPELKAKIHAEIARELDRAENEGRPAITIIVENADREDVRDKKKSPDSGSETAIHFGNVRYLSKKTASMTIANTGRVQAKLCFAGKPIAEQEQDGMDSQWLSTSFVRTDLGVQAGDAEAVDLGTEVTLDPGETVKAVIEVSVDDIYHVRRLNDRQSSLEDVLVLRVEDGRDHFIPITATWGVTCIGRSVDELIRVPDGGIRTFVERLCQEKNKGSGSLVGSIPYDLEVRCAAPKELFKLTEAVEMLTDRALADEQMLHESERLPRGNPSWPFPESPGAAPPSGNLDLQAAVVDMLDQDKPIAEAFSPETPASTRLEVVAAVLLIFLQGLTDGVITIPLWTRIEQASLASLSPGYGGSGSHAQNEDDKSAILDILATAPNHNICFVFLTTTLAKVVAELTPLSKADLNMVQSPIALVRRSLSFRRAAPGPKAASDAIAAMERRMAKEKRVAEILTRARVSRTSPAANSDRERKAAEDKQRALLELFLRRPREQML